MYVCNRSPSHSGHFFLMLGVSKQLCSRGPHCTIQHGHVIDKDVRIPERNCNSNSWNPCWLNMSAVSNITVECLQRWTLSTSSRLVISSLSSLVIKKLSCNWKRTGEERGARRRLYKNIDISYQYTQYSCQTKPHIYMHSWWNKSGEAPRRHTAQFMLLILLLITFNLV